MFEKSISYTFAFDLKFFQNPGGCDKQSINLYRLQTVFYILRSDRYVRYQGNRRAKKDLEPTPNGIIM